MAMARTIELVQKPTLVLCHNKTLAAQLCAEFREFFPKKRGRVLRLVLRLLPARGVRPVDRHLYRKGQLDQRGDRASAPFRDAIAADAPRHADRCLGLLHLRSRLALGLHGDVGPHLRRRGRRPRRLPAQARRHAVPAQRPQLGARNLPRARRYARVRRRRGRARPSHQLFRRHDRSDQRRQPAHRRISREQTRADDLPGQALHHARGETPARDRVDRGRARGPARLFQAARKAAGSAALGDAHALRPRHVARGRLLQRHRELFAPPHRARTGLDALVLDRLLSQGLAALRGRVARDVAASARHVRG